MIRISNINIQKSDTCFCIKAECGNSECKKNQDHIKETIKKLRKENRKAGIILTLTDLMDSEFCDGYLRSREGNSR